METQGVPFDSLRVLPSKTSHVSLLRRESLREIQDSPLEGEEVGLFKITCIIVRKRSRFS